MTRVTRVKDRRKIKELNLLLDDVVSYLTHNRPVYTKLLKVAAQRLAETKGNETYFIEEVREALRAYDAYNDISNVVRRPFEERQDGLYYTGKDR